MFRFMRTRSCGGWFLRSRRCADLDAPISIDTTKARVAREAARLGACVINDVWGMQRDLGMADAVAETGSAVVIMHNRDQADEAIDILDDVDRFFERSLNLAAGAGVPFGRICSIRESALARRGGRTTPASGISIVFAASARRSWSGSRASRSSAGSSTPRSIGACRARSPPIRSRSCAGLRCCGCTTSSKIARRSPCSWRCGRRRAFVGVEKARPNAHRPRSWRQCRRQSREPAPGARRPRQRAGDRTRRGLPLLPHRALGQDRPGLVRQRLRARPDEAQAGGAAGARQGARGRARPRARGALGAARDRHRPHRLRRRDAQDRTADPAPSRTVQSRPSSSRRWPKSRPICVIAGVRVGEAAARLEAEAAGGRADRLTPPGGRRPFTKIGRKKAQEVQSL